jgi:hypothetical protein
MLLALPHSLGHIEQTAFLPRLKIGGKMLPVLLDILLF